MLTSIFEIIGPIMIGPSSSHTAGMARIGKMAYYISGKKPISINLFLSPMMRTTYSGHRTDTALFGGAMGFAEDNSCIRNAINIAHERGIKTSVDFLPPNKYPQNSACLIIKDRDNDVTKILGTSIGGGSIVIKSVDDVPLNITPDAYHFLVWSKEKIEINSKKNKIQIGKNEREYITCLTFLQKPTLELYQQILQKNNIRKIRLVEPVLSYGGTCSENKSYHTLEEVKEDINKNRTNMANLSIEYECNRSGRSREVVVTQMLNHLMQMKYSVEIGSQGNHMLYGLTSGEDGKRLLNAIKGGRTISGGIIPIAVARAISVMEYNGAMGCIVAAPTAGSSGIMPGSMITIQEKYNIPDEKIVDALFVAGLIGVVMAHRGVSFSGSVGGCQGEVGVSSAITAAALTSLFSDNPDDILHAMAICLKNILGLVCDPIAGPIEVPCIKRNAIGVANAYIAADMALSGIRSYISPDEVIDALIDVEKRLPQELKCATIGGLASTDKAHKLRQQLHQDN